MKKHKLFLKNTFQNIKIFFYKKIFLYFMKKIINYSVHLSIAWLIIIFVLSSFPIPNLNIPDFWDRVNIDKLGHSLFYFILTFFLFIYFFSQKKSIFLKKNAFSISMIISISFGGIMEVLQEFIFTHRFGDFIDFFANAFGTFCLLFFVKKIAKMKDLNK